MSKASSHYDSPFNLSELKEFNPAIVYSFQPEQPNLREQNSVYGTIHIAHQFQDVLNAYLYAQNTILPMLKKNRIDGVSEEQLAEWINQLHLRMAKAVAADCKDIKLAGQYTSVQVYRWNHTKLLQKLLGFYFSDFISKENLLEQAKEFGCDIQDFQTFITLQEQVHIRLKKTQKPLASTDPYINILEDISERFHQGKLATRDQKIIHKFVRISTNPKQIPEKMQAFLHQLKEKWLECKADNIDSIVELAYFAFYQLTEIHPYFNGNGRTATCLLNLILRYFNQPSILLRLPEDRDNPQSEYSQAISYIQEKPFLLKTLIKARIKGQNLTHDAFKTRVTYNRVEAGSVLHYLQSRMPAPELERQFKTVMLYLPICMEDMITKVNESLSNPLTTPDDAQTLLNQCNDLILKYSDLPAPRLNEAAQYLMLADYESGLKHFRKLKSQFEKTSTTSEQHVSPVIKKQYSKKEKDQIVEKLRQLTDHSEWKAFGKESVTFLLELDDITVAQDLTEKLNRTGALQAKQVFLAIPGKPGERGKPVIKVTAVSGPKLQEITDIGLKPSPGTAKSLQLS